MSAVAYSNEDSLQQKQEKQVIKWSNRINYHIINAGKIPELTGYIKDMAWFYEKEIRIKAKVPCGSRFQKVTIPMTDELINEMTLTASPLFEGNLKDALKKQVDYQIKTEKSIFTKRLNIKTVCQDCEWKKGKV